jgi:hypothetical protein
MGCDRKKVGASGSVERGGGPRYPGTSMKRRVNEGPQTGAPQFRVAFIRALAALDVAVREVLASGWDEPLRRRALEMSIALRESSMISGWKETRGILQAISSLLAMSVAEILPLRVALREKLLELLGLLDDSLGVETA